MPKADCFYSSQNAHLHSIFIFVPQGSYEICLPIHHATSIVLQKNDLNFLRLRIQSTSTYLAFVVFLELHLRDVPLKRSINAPYDIHHTITMARTYAYPKMLFPISKTVYFLSLSVIELKKIANGNGKINIS